MFPCPQCGGELADQQCPDCGFIYDATPAVDNEVTSIRTRSVEELLTAYHDRTQRKPSQTPEQQEGRQNEDWTTSHKGGTTAVSQGPYSQTALRDYHPTDQRNEEEKDGNEHMSKSQGRNAGASPTESDSGLNRQGANRPLTSQCREESD